jgi:hypothetical protein
MNQDRKTNPHMNNPLLSKFTTLNPNTVTNNNISNINLNANSKTNTPITH